jgi:hypothetical protein
MKKIGAHLDTVFRNMKFGHYKPDVIQTQLKEVTVFSSGYFTAREKILADKRLTEDGKNAARREAREPIITELEKWRDKKLAGIDADISAQKADLYLSTKVEQSKIDALAPRLRAFKPEEIAILHNSAPDDDVRRTLEATSLAEGLIPIRSANGALDWRFMLDPRILQEAVEARALKTNPAGVAKLREAEEIREMTITAANIAIAEIREA